MKQVPLADPVDGKNLFPLIKKTTKPFATLVPYRIVRKTKKSVKTQKKNHINNSQHKKTSRDHFFLIRRISIKLRFSDQIGGPKPVPVPSPLDSRFHIPVATPEAAESKQAGDSL